MAEAIMTAGEAPRCVLVTGANGYVGGSVIGHLLERGDIREIRAGICSEQAADQVRKQWPGEKRLTPVLGDLPRAPWSLDGVEVLIHAAAWISARPSPNGDEFYAVNAEGTRRLLAAARQAGVSRAVYFSTQAVYGTSEPPPWREDQLPRPETHYALSKWMGETFCGHQFGRFIPTAILRLARIYGVGPFMRWQDFSHKFAALAAHGRPLPVHGAGAESVDCLPVRDFCGAVARACEIPLPPDQPVTLNVGSGNPQTVANYAALCVETANRLGLSGSSIEFIPGPTSRVRHFELDITRAKACLQWQPAAALDRTVSELIMAARQQDMRFP